MELMKSVTFVSDRGANVKKALEVFNWLPCCCHILNTVLYHVFRIKPASILCNDNEENEETLLYDETYYSQISSVVKLLTEVKDLVTYLKRSGLACMLTSSVIQECETRWNTKLAVLISVNKVFDEIETLLIEKGQQSRLENIDIVLMNELINFLLPFKQVSEAMEGDKYPTIHGVLLWKKKLLDHCKTLPTNTIVLKMLKLKCTQLIKSKWPSLDTYKIALFLFPKFKSLSVLPVECAVEVPNLVREKLDVNQSSSNSGFQPMLSSDHTYQNVTQKKRKFDFALDFNDYADTPNTEQTYDEVTKYIHADFSSECTTGANHLGGFDVIKFWNQQSSLFPKLAKFAKSVLSTPCSSASSERVFSCAARVYEERRNQLHPESINAIVFLNSFLKE
uniref:Uncharacterized protein zf(Bed)-1 n=1 Tax=Phallusia mammillata TaxID=59560 RepID=A0A6F9DAF9_9ASCI|nr:uncharacterized protein zf(bed)-1 [Phallusia mammillata]